MGFFKRKLKGHESQINCRILDSVIKEKLQGLFMCVAIKDLNTDCIFDHIIASMIIKFLGGNNHRKLFFLEGMS